MKKIIQNQKENDDDPEKTPPYYKTISINEEEDESELNNISNNNISKPKPKLKSYTAPKEVLEDITLGEHRDAFNPKQQQLPSLINRKRQRDPSPARNDPLSKASKNKSDRGFKDIMKEQKAKTEQAELLRKQQREEYKKMRNTEQSTMNSNINSLYSNDNEMNNQEDNISVVSKDTKLTNNLSEWDKIDKKEGLSITNVNSNNTLMTPRKRRWDINAMDTPVNLHSNLMETPKGKNDCLVICSE